MRRALSGRARSSSAGCLLAFIMGLGCADFALESERVPASENGYTLSSTHFWLQVDTEGTQPRADGIGFETSNNLGHRLEITEAWLAFSAASFAPCSSVVASRHRQEHLADGWVWVRKHVIPDAHAGHPDDYGEASVRRPLVEDLTRAEPVHLGDRSFASSLFCHAHYVSGQAPDTAEGIAAIDSMRGRTLLIRGWVQRAVYEERVGFEVKTDINHGQLVELKEIMQALANAQTVEMTITRHLGTMFDGVDVLADEEAGYMILRNLVGDATLSLRAVSALD